MTDTITEALEGLSLDGSPRCEAWTGDCAEASSRCPSPAVSRVTTFCGHCRDASVIFLCGPCLDLAQAGLGTCMTCGSSRAIHGYC